MNKIVMSALVVIGFSEASAWAVDPVSAGNTSIGTHPSYGGAYSGFWRAGAPDYSLLTDGTDTFVNSPTPDGHIWFRTHNQNIAYLQSSGLTVIKGLTVIGTVYNAGPSEFQGPVGIYSGAVMHGGVTIGEGPLIIGDSSPTEFHAPVTMFNGASLRGVVTLGNPTTDGTLQVNGTPGQYALDVRGTASQPTGGPSYGIYAKATDLAIYADGPIIGTTYLQIGASGYKPGGGMWAAVSDRRVKKDVVDFKMGLAELSRVHPVRYKYNGLGGSVNDGKEYVGVIAQELEAIAPFMVSSRQNKLHKDDAAPTDLKQVDASAFTYMLVNAVQDLAKQNTEMRRLICQDHPADPSCGAAKGTTQLARPGRKLASLRR